MPHVDVVVVPMSEAEAGHLPRPSRSDKVPASDSAPRDVAPPRRRGHVRRRRGAAGQPPASRTLTLTLAGITRGVRGAWTDTTSGAATALVGAARVADGANTFVAPHGPADSYVLRHEVL